MPGKGLKRIDLIIANGRFNEAPKQAQDQVLDYLNFRSGTPRSAIYFNCVLNMVGKENHKYVCGI